jgi:hypothetical protein
LLATRDQSTRERGIGSQLAELQRGSVQYLVLIASVTYGRAVLIQADWIQGGDQLHIAQPIQLSYGSGPGSDAAGAPSCWAGTIDGCRAQIANSPLRSNLVLYG